MKGDAERWEVQYHRPDLRIVEFSDQGACERLVPLGTGHSRSVRLRRVQLVQRPPYFSVGLFPWL